MWLARWMACTSGGGAPFEVPAPFEVACGVEGVASSCEVRHGGRPVGEPLGSFAGPDDLLRPVGGIWLATTYAGDSCPTQLVAFCVVDGKAARTEAFGNCEEPSAIEVGPAGVEVRFAVSSVDPVHRPARRARIDPSTCGLEERSPAAERE